MKSPFACAHAGLLVLGSVVLTSDATALSSRLAPILMGPSGLEPGLRYAAAEDPPPPAPKPSDAVKPSDAAKPSGADKPSGAKTPGTAATVVNLKTIEGVMGKSVRSRTNEDMGRVVDVLVDGGGQLRAAVIDFGGFLGVGSRKVAVAWKTLDFTDSIRSGSVKVTLTRDQVRQSPEYKPDEPIVILEGGSPPKPEGTAQPNSEGSPTPKPEGNPALKPEAGAPAKPQDGPPAKPAGNTPPPEHNQDAPAR